MGACGSKGSTSDQGVGSDKDGKNAKDRKEAWERIRQAIPREKTPRQNSAASSSSRVRQERDREAVLR
ncbi:hypothetical protein TcBrA4_0006600 [Trypanosoma cruzi]|nr:hypothetical protein TcBrA4_0006600 [Trypanosoma cruzi]